MKELVQLLENHAGIVLLVMLVILLIDILVSVTRNGSAKNKIGIKASNNQALLATTLMKDGFDGYILVDNATNLPISVSENINKFLGVDAKSVYADITLLFRGLSNSDRQRFDEELKELNLNEISQYVFEAYWQLPGEERKSFYQVTIGNTNNGKNRLITLYDLTEEKKKRDLLAEEVTKARRSEESKTAFLSNMSHEIRTPLNGMLGMIGLAKMNIEDTKDATECLDKAESLSKFLLSVINDILDMSRIESGKTQLEEVTFDIRKTFEKLDNMFRGTITEKKINFETELVDVRNPYVVGDELRITQVITNFLSNASKFTKEGGTISLTIRQNGIMLNMGYL